MTKTWILVAERSGARIYERTARNAPLTMLKEIENPAGRLKNRELASDKHGQAAQTGRHDLTAFGQNLSPKESVSEKFAKELADLMNHGIASNACQELVLIAEPNFLGQINSSLSKQADKHLRFKIDKNLSQLDETALGNEISARW